MAKGSFKPQKDILMTSAHLIAGAVGTKLVKNVVKNVIPASAPDIIQKLSPAIPLIGGIFLSGVKGMEKVSYGMIAAGGAELAGKFIPAIAGLEDMDLSGIFGSPLNGPLNGVNSGNTGQFSEKRYRSSGYTGTNDNYSQY